MATCPICHQPSDDIIREQKIDVRGTPYLRQMCFCPSCAIKFTFFEPLEKEEPKEKSEEAEVEAPEEEAPKG